MCQRCDDLPNQPIKEYLASKPSIDVRTSMRCGIGLGVFVSTFPAKQRLWKVAQKVYGNASEVGAPSPDFSPRGEGNRFLLLKS